MTCVDVDLGRIAEELAVPWRARRSMLGPFPERWYEPLVVADTYEAWLLGWGAGHGLELHDHGASVGAIAMVSGELTEYAVTPGESHLRHRVLRPGDTLRFGVGHVHHVTNEQVENALSVHVYAPRLRSMTFYDHRAESFLTPLREEVLV